MRIVSTGSRYCVTRQYTNIKLNTLQTKKNGTRKSPALKVVLFGRSLYLSIVARGYSPSDQKAIVSTTVRAVFVVSQ